MAKASKKVNKTQFILGLPKLSAAEVVEKAKKAGIKLNDKYVYNIRSHAKVAKGSKKKKLGRPKGSTNVKKAATRGGVSKVNGSSQESIFVNAALDLGLGRAEEILGGIRSAAETALE